MMVFNKILSSILLAVVYAAVANAAPYHRHARHATHRVRHIGRGVQVETYNPKSSYKTFGAGLEQQSPATGVASLAGGNGTAPSIAESATEFMMTQLGLQSNEVSYRSGFQRDAQRFAFVRQQHNGVPFANAVANIAWNNGKVVSFGNSFIQPTSIAPSTPSVAFPSVVSGAENKLDAKLVDLEPTVEYLVRQDGSAALTHVFQLRNEDTNAWYEAFVDAHSGELLSVTDFVSHASYTVVPVSKLSIEDGLQTLVDPQDLESSPLGWHDDGDEATVFTSGNNVLTATTSVDNVSRQSSAGLNFNFQFDDSQDPELQGNIRAARVNAFFIINTVHDVTHRYGFKENTFNFQQNNFGNGGQDGDRVLVSVQDAGGFNNANFATPPDGQSGICRMFIWTLTEPRRDGAMENDILIHEMAHGITGRMTGGGSARCLQSEESGGLGEGWSDSFAEWFQQTDGTIRDFTVGNYVTNSANGIRRQPYSTNEQVNNLKYSSVQTSNGVHQIGEVWATMLHDVYAALVTENGFGQNFLTDATGSEGNVIFMRVLLEALLVQPCNPTFVTARDAWLQADQNLFNGQHVCTIARAFANRGLGLNADNFQDDATLPAGCA